MEPIWSPVVAGQLLLGDAAARLEDDKVGGDVGEVMRVKQPQQSDLELAVFAPCAVGFSCGQVSFHSA